ncbi:phage major tail protein, TP901-1 family [Chryseobacterium oranimense]|uniref:Phage major tail protein, TP901-1 family n=1 Tax=Chryseobacterium oranimense TaxID=421058 RepID=A0A1M5V0P5_9FLAO|nr:phage tail tube protein [Chryseobacterium oranimense]SHH68799.1 phage major tail protein, TP901-1 family [Chryseobacterium oranimense]
MAGEKSLLGANEILFIYGPIKDAAGTTVAANYFPVGCLTTNELTKTVEMQDGTITKCNASPDPTYGRKSYQITFEAVAIEADGMKASYDAVSDAMDDAHENKKPIFWKIETTQSDGTKETKFGKGFLSDLSRTAPVEGEITFSGTIQGSGEISNTDLHV